MNALHVVFKVGEAEYVLAASDVLQMETFSRATEVPGAASYVAGLVQLRGQVIPVVDLRARFGLPPIARTLDARVLVVRDGDRVVGLLADSAREVINLDTETFQKPPGAIGTQSAGFVSAVAQAGTRLVMQIDFQKVIGQDGIPKERKDGAET